MTEQPEALRLADYWDRRADKLQTWVDENDYVEFGYRPEGLKQEQADQRKTAAELRRLHEANQELIKACQTIVSAFDALPLGDAARYARLNINAARAAIAKHGGAA